MNGHEDYDWTCIPIIATRTGIEAHCLVIITDEAVGLLDPSFLCLSCCGYGGVPTQDSGSDRDLY